MDPKIQGFKGWGGPGSYAAYDPAFAAGELWFKS
jgi:hypothetical protein